MMTGYTTHDEKSSVIALAKQLLMDCQAPGDITVPRESLKLILTAFTQNWLGEQDMRRSEFKKVAK